MTEDLGPVFPAEEILESLAMAVIATDVSGAIVYWNREADLVVRQAVRRITRRPDDRTGRRVEPACIPQRGLLLEVPARTTIPGRTCGGIEVAVDHLARREHVVGGGLAGHGDAVFGLGAHHPPHGHTGSLRGPRIERAGLAVAAPATVHNSAAAGIAVVDAAECAC